jgi:hypothetical protein
MPTLHNHLLAPVVVVTKGRGLERFEDTRELFKRLEEIPTLKDSILSIQHGGKALSEDGIAALETMLWLTGFAPFKRASLRRGAPFSRFATRWNWTFLGEYLGWDWRSL